MNNQVPQKATDPCDLERMCLDPNIAKSEVGWWAARTIEQLRAENAALKEQVAKLELKNRASVPALVHLTAAQQETIIQQALVIEQMWKALDRIANSRVGQVDSIAQELFNREDWAREAAALQPSPEALDTHNIKIAEACAAAIADWSDIPLGVVGAIRSGEWRKYL